MVEIDRQLPLNGEIFLDHVGHFVHDRDAAARVLARAGFAPTPPSVQTNPGPDGAPQLTGTGNVTAMLKRGYVEVLFETADTPLGRELDTALARYAGVHLVAFAVADAAREHRRLSDAGFRTRPLVELRRPVETATGSDSAAFTVARVEPGEMPEGRIQMLTHHTEAAVWQPRWLAHRNGAIKLANVTIAVADVNEAAARFARLADRPVHSSLDGQVVRLDRGHISFMTAAGFGKHFPDIPVPALPFIGAYGIEVASLTALAELLSDAGLLARQSGRGLVVPFPTELGTGAWVFTEALKAPASPAG